VIHTRPRHSAAQVGAVAILVVLLAGCSDLGEQAPDDQPVRDDEGLIVEPNDQTDAFALEVGDCLDDDALRGEVQTVPTVACTEPHDSEIYASHQLELSPYPGNEAIIAQAEALCETSFEVFVGVPYLDSPLDYSFYHPTQQSWVTGDREVLCVIYDPAGPVTGSLEGVIDER
jgi:hypothetical protein